MSIGRRKSGTIARVCMAALAFTPSPARAGAWTLPEGHGLIIQSLFGWLGQGPAAGVPDAARESKAVAQTYVEYGFTDGMTLVGQMSVERYALSPPTPYVYAGLGYSGGGARVRLWRDDAWAFSLEAGAYASGARDASRPAQAGNTGPAAELRALAGRNLTLFGAPAFIDAAAGYRWRTEGPPSEWRGDLTLGVAWSARTQVLAQSFTLVSNGAGSPGFPAWASEKAQLSLVYALDENWSLQVGGFATLFRRNVNSEYGALAALWRRF